MAQETGAGATEVDSAPRPPLEPILAGCCATVAVVTPRSMSTSQRSEVGEWNTPIATFRPSGEICW